MAAIFFYGITLVLTGIGIYVHGLFSRQLLTWSGALQILLGLVMIAVSPELHVQEWVAASAFGIGFPAFALMVDRTRERSAYKELLLSLSWLLLVLVSAFIAMSIGNGHLFDGWQRVSWESYRQTGTGDVDEAVVTMPSGSLIPVTIQITGDLLQPVEQLPPLIMRTTSPVDLAIERGEVLGMMRIGDGEWRAGHDYRVNGWEAKGWLSSQQGPSIDLRMNVEFER